MEEKSNKDRDKLWHTPSMRARYESCCGHIDKDCFDFIIRMIFIFCILIFSMIQLILHKDNEKQQVYLSIVTSIMGYMIPSPTLKGVFKS